MPKKKKTPAPPTKPVKPPAFGMQKPNDDLFEWGGRLDNVRLPAPKGATTTVGRPLCHTSDGPLGSQNTWLEPEIFLPLCAADVGLQSAIAQAFMRKFSQKALQAVCAQLTRVFEEQYVVQLFVEFDKTSALLAEYLVASEAWTRKHPEEPPEEA